MSHTQKSSYIIYHLYVENCEIIDRQVLKLDRTYQKCTLRMFLFAIVYITYSHTYIFSHMHIHFSHIYTFTLISYFSSPDIIKVVG